MIGLREYLVVSWWRLDGWFGVVYEKVMVGLFEDLKHDWTAYIFLYV
jgi:hypothetical protein